MTYLHDHLGLQIAEEDDLRKSQQQYVSQGQLTHLHSRAMSSAMERRESYSTSVGTSFSPTTSTNQLSDEVQSIASSTANGWQHGPSLHMQGHVAEPFLERNPLLEGNDHSHWRSTSFNGFVDMKASPSLHTVSHDLVTPNEHHEAHAFQLGFSSLSQSLSPSSPDLQMTSGVAYSSLPPSISMSSPASYDREWMVIDEHKMDKDSLPTHMRRKSSPRQLTSGDARRDGVRKKNARQEIPEGHNLQTIDRDIARATDHGDVEEVKTLKTYKRLLRNRQAALDSRQRKKKHTEELEVAQKVWQEERNDLQTRADMLQNELDQEKRRATQLQQTCTDFHHQNGRLTSQIQRQMGEHASEKAKLVSETNYWKDRCQNILTNNKRAVSTFDVPTTDRNELQPEEWADPKILGIHDEQDGTLHSTFNMDDVHSMSQSSYMSISTATILDKDDPRDSITSETLHSLLLLYGAMIASGTSINDATSMLGLTDQVRVHSAAIVASILRHGDTNHLDSSTIASQQVSYEYPAAATITINNKKLLLPPQSRSRTDSLVHDSQQSHNGATPRGFLTFNNAYHNILPQADFTSHSAFHSGDPSLDFSLHQNSTVSDNHIKNETEVDELRLDDAIAHGLILGPIPDDVLSRARTMTRHDNEFHDNNMNK